MRSYLLFQCFSNEVREEIQVSFALYAVFGNRLTSKNLEDRQSTSTPRQEDQTKLEHEHGKNSPTGGPSLEGSYSFTTELLVQHNENGCYDLA